MDAMASQITGLTIVYPTVYSGADQRKHHSSASLALFTGEFPAQMASNAEMFSFDDVTMLCIVSNDISLEGTGIEELCVCLLIGIIRLITAYRPMSNDTPHDCKCPI